MAELGDEGSVHGDGGDRSCDIPMALRHPKVLQSLGSALTAHPCCPGTGDAALSWKRRFCSALEDEMLFCSGRGDAFPLPWKWRCFPPALCCTAGVSQVRGREVAGVAQAGLSLPSPHPSGWRRRWGLLGEQSEMQIYFPCDQQLELLGLGLQLQGSALGCSHQNPT